MTGDERLARKQKAEQMRSLLPKTQSSVLGTQYCRRGLTLLEMLAVLTIVSLMMGLSVGVYLHMNRVFREQGAAAALDVALRQARNAAISAGAPAFVEIDVEKRRIVPWVYHTVGFWNFEDRTDFGRTTGAYRDAMMRGAELFPEGKVGKCARLRENCFVDLGADPDYDCEDGGYLEAYIRPACYTFIGDNFVFFKKNAYYLKVGLRGVLVGNAGGKTVQSVEYHIVPGRWSKVAMAWDHYSTRLLVDDCLVGLGPGGKTPVSDYPLLVGHETASLEGLVDEVRVMSASAGEAVQLPSGYSIKHTAAPWSAVYFASDGTLDIRYHTGPVSITLLKDNRARTVAISMLGQTTRAEVEQIETKDEVVAAAASAPASKKLTVYNTEDGGTPPKPKDQAPKTKTPAPDKKGNERGSKSAEPDSKVGQAGQPAPQGGAQ